MRTHIYSERKYEGSQKGALSRAVYRDKNREKLRLYGIEYRKTEPYKLCIERRKNSNKFKLGQLKYRRSEVGVCKQKELDLKRKLSGEYFSPEIKFASYKANAKRRGHEFLLSFEQFMLMWRKPCFYCGSEIKTIGIDRVNNSVGYVSGNVVPCCKQCNVAKMDNDIFKYIEHCAKVVMHFKMSSFAPEALDSEGPAL